MQFTNNTKEPEADELAIVGLLYALDIIILNRVYALLLLGFLTVQKLLGLEGIIANATYDLTESIGFFFVQSAPLGLTVLPVRRSRCAVSKTALGLIVGVLLAEI